MLLRYTKKYLFVGIFIFSLLVFFAHTAFTKTAIFADGRYYYAITRSLVKDYDIDFVNEYISLGMVEDDFTGPAENIYPPGVSFFWAPLFWTVDSLINSINISLRISIDDTGFNLLYQSAVAITSTFLGTLGLYLVYVLLKDYFSEKVSLYTTFAFFATTNLLFYIAVEPINSHAVSFFVSSLFIYYFLRHQKDQHYYFTLGVIGGVAGLVRTQDLLILIIPAIRIIKEHKLNLTKLITNLKPLSAGVILGFLPQLVFWKAIFGNFWYSPYFGYSLNFLKPKFFHVLFNTDNGLFTLTPAILIAVLGLLLFRKRGSQIFLYATVYFLLQLYLITSWQYYSQGGSFSIRMMITTYPLLSFGLASVIKKSNENFGEIKTLFLIFFFSILNSAFIIRYLLIF
ncbi:MAG: glycosyltransferase family 39 protein [Patescibacteria group bacterium]